MKRLDLNVLDTDRGERLDRFLRKAGGISLGAARRVLEAGGVYLDGKRVKIASRPVWPGQKIGVSSRSRSARRSPRAPAAERWRSSSRTIGCWRW